MAKSLKIGFKEAEIIMATVGQNRFLKSSLRIACAVVGLTASSAWAAFVTWDLNPDALNQDLGTATNSYTVAGFTIGAHGYDNNNGVGTPHELHYRFDANEMDERGLGLAGTLHNELQVGPNGVPVNFIQLDLTSILALNFVNGRISVGSVQPGELFNIYGSNTLGMLGTLLNSTPYGSEVDSQFVSVPNFGTYHYISIVAAALDVLPVAFQAELAPIPEAATLVPVALLVVVATLLELRRRRKATA